MANVCERYARLVSDLERKEFVLHADGLPGCSSEEEAAKSDELLELCAQLGDISAELNEAKTKVNSVCKLHGVERWHSFTKFTHPLKHLPQWMADKVANQLSANDCCEGGQKGAVLEDFWPSEFQTQAYCKLLQLATACPSLLEPLRRTSGQIRSLHLCELPGAFVIAISHCLGPDLCSRWEWRTNSLNPYWKGTNPPQMATSDRLIVQFPQRMAFGPDGSGDLLCWDDAYLKKEFPQKFALVTADGGIDCTEDPLGQESSTHKLISKQAEVAMKCLEAGGNLLLKAYTFFESSTIKFLAGLCANFREVRCVKPASSKPGNSELYLLCLEFKGQICAPKPISKVFLERIVDCAETFARHQIDFIDFNLHTFRRLCQQERTLIEMEKCTIVTTLGSKLLSQIQINQQNSFNVI